MVIQRPASLAKSVASVLRERLKNRYVNGGRLPSEPEIASELGVSRGTVRQALTILEREGTVFRRQGSGTYANQYVLRIPARAESAYEFTELISQAGYQASIQVVAIETTCMPDEALELMSLPPAAEALIVRKLFLADGKPAIYCTDMLPRSIILAEYASSELHQPIFEFLERRCGQTISHCVAEIIPEVVDETLAHLLDMAPGRPLLRFDEIGFNGSNQPVLFSRVYYRDQYVRFSILRKKM
jgi:GntR family transcriptional regulator